MTCHVYVTIHTALVNTVNMKYIECMPFHCCTTLGFPGKKFQLEVYRNVLRNITILNNEFCLNC